MKLLLGAFMVLFAVYGILNVNNGTYRRGRMPFIVMATIFLAAIVLRLLTRH